MMGVFVGEFEFILFLFVYVIVFVILSERQCGRSRSGFFEKPHIEAKEEAA